MVIPRKWNWKIHQWMPPSSCIQFWGWLGFSHFGLHRQDSDLPLGYSSLPWYQESWETWLFVIFHLEPSLFSEASFLSFLSNRLIMFYIYSSSSSIYGEDVEESCRFIYFLTKWDRWCRSQHAILLSNVYTLVTFVYSRLIDYISTAFSKG